MRSSLVLAVILAPTMALAEPAPAGANAEDELLDELLPHLHFGVGVDVSGEKGALAVAGRIHVTAAHHFGQGRLRPFIGAGLDVASAKLRPLRGDAFLPFDSVGPVVQVGLRSVDGGFADTIVYATAAKLRLAPSMQLRAKLDDVDLGSGTRIAIGAAFGDQVLSHLPNSNEESPGAFLGTLLLILVPHALEVSWERGFGSDRVGVSLGYGF